MRPPFAAASRRRLPAPRLVGLLLAGLVAVFTVLPVQAQEATLHTIKPGETLYSISRSYGLTVEALRQLNGLQGNLIRVGEKLIVRLPATASSPGAEAARVATPEAAAPEAAAPPPPDPTATPPPRRPPVSEDRESATPPAAQPTEPAAQTAEPSTAGDAPRRRMESVEAATETEPATYAAGVGETFYSIAARFGTQAYRLFPLNDGRTAPLAPGLVVRLPALLADATHRVVEGETLYGLAQRYDVDEGTLRRINRIQGEALAVGQELLIPAGTELRPRSRDALPPRVDAGLLLRYSDAFEGRLTASGRVYDADAFTVSHLTLPFGTVVLLTNPLNGRSTFAEVTDRGPLDGTYLMDASAAVFRQLGLAPGERQRIEVRLVE